MELELYCSFAETGMFDRTAAWQCCDSPLAAIAAADLVESTACRWKQGPRAVFQPLGTDIHLVASRLIKQEETIGEHRSSKTTSPKQARTVLRWIS